MNIRKTRENAAMTMALEGRLDTLTAPEFEAELRELGGISELTLDLAELKYVSSAGLRVLLAAQKLMKKQGVMRVVHVTPGVMEVFEMTGFADVLAIEK